MQTDIERYWAAAFFDSRDTEVINDMAAMARRMLICQRELQRDELARLKMKYPHLTTKD
jgi:hypothetical protein